LHTNRKKVTTDLTADHVTTHRHTKDGADIITLTHQKRNKKQQQKSFGHTRSDHLESE
jgi:hypothetical protein